HAGELRLRVGHGLAHLLGRLGEDVIDHWASLRRLPPDRGELSHWFARSARSRPPPRGPIHRTSVPIGSPSRARRMLPGCITSKTTIGSWLSMQKVMAVESITFRPRFRTSRYSTSLNFVASGLTRGSSL